MKVPLYQSTTPNRWQTNQSLFVFTESLAISLEFELGFTSCGTLLNLCFLKLCFLSWHREEEHSKLSADLEIQPKLAPRRSYIQRITEITKNSRKQDADIERILKETRELQLESNSIQERLHRTYAVVDETVFRYCTIQVDLAFHIVSTFFSCFYLSSYFLTSKYQYHFKSVFSRGMTNLFSNMNQIMVKDLGVFVITKFIIKVDYLKQKFENHQNET